LKQNLIEREGRKKILKERNWREKESSCEKLIIRGAK